MPDNGGLGQGLMNGARSATETVAEKDAPHTPADDDPDTTQEITDPDATQVITVDLDAADFPPSSGQLTRDEPENTSDVRRGRD